MELTKDDSLPLWIQRIKQSEELANAKAEANKQRDLIAVMKVEHDGPEFWTRFVREMERQTKLFDSIGIRGSALIVGSVNSEAQCHIEAALGESLYPKMAKLSYFYRKGQTWIRAFSFEKDAPEFHFQIHPEGLLAITNGSSIPMSPEAAADFALEWIVSKVKQ